MAEVRCRLARLNKFLNCYFQSWVSFSGITSLLVISSFWCVLHSGVKCLMVVHCLQICSSLQGFFQLLFSCIEKLLAFMNVKNIVLPAAEEAESIWTQKFGFRKLTAEEVGLPCPAVYNLGSSTSLTYFRMRVLLQVMNLRRKCWQIVTFKGTCMLQKPVHGRRNSSRTADLADISSSMWCLTKGLMYMLWGSDIDESCFPLIWTYNCG